MEERETNEKTQLVQKVHRQPLDLGEQKSSIEDQNEKFVENKRKDYHTTKLIIIPTRIQSLKIIITHGSKLFLKVLVVKPPWPQSTRMFCPKFIPKLSDAILLSVSSLKKVN